MNTTSKDLVESCPQCRQKNPDIKPCADGTCGVCGGTGKITWHAVGRIEDSPAPTENIEPLQNPPPSNNTHSGFPTENRVLEVLEPMRDFTPEAMQELYNGGKGITCQPENRESAWDVNEKLANKLGEELAQAGPSESVEKVPYNQLDHSHCWNNKSPACGQKIKHFECCLCQKPHPEITELAKRYDKDFLAALSRHAQEERARTIEEVLDAVDAETEEAQTFHINREWVREKLKRD